MKNVHWNPAVSGYFPLFNMISMITFEWTFFLTKKFVGKIHHSTP